MIKTIITERMFNELGEIESIYVKLNDCYQEQLAYENLTNAERLVAEELESKTFIKYNTLFTQMEHIRRFNETVKDKPEYTDFILDCILDAVDEICEYERGELI